MAGRLFIIGMGICDEGDMPSKALDALRGCSRVFAESYTNLMREGTLDRLQGKIGRKIEVLGREAVEGEKIILEAAKNSDVSLLVPGDPMAATTHSSLVEGARKAGIECRIIHASSIITSAAGECGLQAYKFGKTATITYWRKNFTPTSFIDLIAANRKIGAHTLCLLDIDPILGPMKPTVAIETLLKAQKMAKKKALGVDDKIFVLSHAGWVDQKIWAGALGEWKEENQMVGPAVIIIAGKMHFVEEDSFEYFRAQKK